MLIEIGVVELRCVAVELAAVNPSLSNTFLRIELVCRNIQIFIVRLYKLRYAMQICFVRGSHFEVDIFYVWIPSRVAGRRWQSGTKVFEITELLWTGSLRSWRCRGSSSWRLRRKRDFLSEFYMELLNTQWKLPCLSGRVQILMKTQRGDSSLE